MRSRENKRRAWSITPYSEHAQTTYVRRAHCSLMPASSPTQSALLVFPYFSFNSFTTSLCHLSHFHSFFTLIVRIFVFLLLFVLLCFFCLVYSFSCHPISPVSYTYRMSHCRSHRFSSLPSKGLLQHTHYHKEAWWSERNADREETYSER